MNCQVSLLACLSSNTIIMFVIWSARLWFWAESGLGDACACTLWSWGVGWQPMGKTIPTPGITDLLAVPNQFVNLDSDTGCQVKVFWGIVLSLWTPVRKIVLFPEEYHTTDWWWKAPYMVSVVGSRAACMYAWHSKSRAWIARTHLSSNIIVSILRADACWDCTIINCDARYSIPGYVAVQTALVR